MFGIVIQPQRLQQRPQFRLRAVGSEHRLDVYHRDARRALDDGIAVHRDALDRIDQSVSDADIFLREEGSIRRI